MITATIENNELITTGLPIVDENYPGFCCAGFDYIIVIVNPEYPLESVWGCCQNPDCPAGVDDGNDLYRGASMNLIENFAVKLAEMQCSAVVS